LLWTLELALISLWGIPELELEEVEGLLLDGFVLWSLDCDELDGEVALPDVEGEVLCELLEEDDGDELDGELWSDCGRVEVLELLDELLGEVLDWLLLGDVLDWLLLGDVLDWSLLLELGAADVDDEDEEDGVWLLEGSWSELCGCADVGFCVVLWALDGDCCWSGKVFGVVVVWDAVPWANAHPALIASTIPSR
jgi:hypothetical protein